MEEIWKKQGQYKNLQLKKNELKQYYYHNKDAEQTWKSTRNSCLMFQGNHVSYNYRKKGLKLKRESYNNK